MRAKVLAAILLLSCLAPLGSSPAMASPDRHREVEALERDIAAKLASGAIELPGGPRDIGRYARFYHFDSDVTARAVFSRPVPSVNVKTPDFKPGYFLVDEPRGFQVGGNCDTTIYLLVKNIRTLDYTLHCSAR